MFYINFSNKLTMSTCKTIKNIRLAVCHLPCELQDIIWKKYYSMHVISEILNSEHIAQQENIEQTMEWSNTKVRKVVSQLNAFYQQYNYAFNVGIDVAEDRLADTNDIMKFDILHILKNEISHPSILILSLNTLHSNSHYDILEKTYSIINLHKMIEPIVETDDDESDTEML